MRIQKKISKLWQSQLNKNELIEIEKKCDKILNILNYDFKIYLTIINMNIKLLASYIKMNKLISFEDTIYVAGSTGMVGQSICKALKKDGYGNSKLGGKLLNNK